MSISDDFAKQEAIKKRMKAKRDRFRLRVLVCAAFAGFLLFFFFL